MNSLMTGYFANLEYYLPLRNQLLDILSDADLHYRPADVIPTLGQLCREIGDVEYSYIQSFKTFTQDFDYQNDETGIETSVEKLTIWFAQLDKELKAVVEKLTEDDIENRKIERDAEFKVSLQVQLEIYKEALLIFYGKVSVYLKIMQKPLPQQWKDWIG